MSVVIRTSMYRWTAPRWKRGLRKFLMFIFGWALNDGPVITVFGVGNQGNPSKGEWHACMPEAAIITGDGFVITAVETYVMAMTMEEWSKRCYAMTHDDPVPVPGAESKWPGADGEWRR